MQRGAIQALKGSLLAAYRETKLPIWICGGNASLIHKELKECDINIQYHPNLVLEGMINLVQEVKAAQDH